ncbi:intracellular hyaluronan-binding protein 4-like [Paramormyrops kingsleyae]|uniref:intracellular hyaluronan-binding protein 4-like n=1 Tax=Paramormyrops kingsleyae TaxID=1676925 RepID=UPI000CD5FD6C|nr:intracellular hyaluronan-binding protein 4-like [Paramormyrops kingsleyae]
MMRVIDEAAVLRDTDFGRARAPRFHNEPSDSDADALGLPRESQPRKAAGKRDSKREGHGGGHSLTANASGAQQREERCVSFQTHQVPVNKASLELSAEKNQQRDQGGWGCGGSRVGRDRGGRLGGPPRSTDGFDQRGKREFDRHSGSDRASVRPEEKRGGTGSWNWGSVKDPMRALTDAAAGEEVALNALEEEEKCTMELEIPVDEGAVEISLDEWKALQKQSRPKQQLQLRKADTGVPVKAIVIHKSRQLEGLSSGVSEEEDGTPPPRRAANITSQIDINFGCLVGCGHGGSVPRLDENPPLPPETVVAPNPGDPEDFPALA